MNVFQFRVYSRRDKGFCGVCVWGWGCLYPSVSDYSFFFFHPEALSDYYRCICRLKGQCVCEKLTTEADNVTSQPLYDLLDPSTATHTHGYMYMFT